MVSYCDSSIRLGKYCVVGDNCNISARYDSDIEFGTECVLRDDAYIFDKYASNIRIGDRCTFEKRTTMIAVSGSNILVGSGFMGSFDVSIIDNDGHALYDKASGIRYNHDTSIKIGDNVWVGLKSSILSGSVIPDGAIIGANSVVTKKSKMMMGSAIAGNPAMTVKEGIGWKRYI